jgi:hypothetical protein
MELRYEEYVFQMERIRVGISDMFPFGATPYEIALFEHFAEVRAMAIFNRRQTIKFLERTGGCGKDIALNTIANTIEN